MTGPGRALRVAVVGGGVAGAACAVALARTGARVRVYEAYAEPAGPVGSFLSLAANGLRGLDVLGVLDEVRAAGFGVPRQRMWAGSGKLLGDVPRGRTGSDPMISVTLMRADLVAALQDEARRAGAEIVTGQRLNGEDLAGLARDGAANRDAKVAGPVAARVRDLVRPLFVSRFYEKATAWLYAYDPGTLAGVAEAEKVTE